MKKNTTYDKSENTVFGSFNTMINSYNVKNDNFFPNEIIEKVQEQGDYSVSKRVASVDELSVITQTAFDLLIFWVKSGEITVDFFERFLTILLSYHSKIKDPITEEHIVTIIEMISIVEFHDHVIYTTLNLYTEVPQVLINHHEVIL